MKKIALLLIVILALTVALYLFYKKSYIQHELAFNIPNSNEEFRPQAYLFIHSKDELNGYYQTNTNTKELQAQLTNATFNFDKYSYCIFYGKRVKTMEISKKQSIFDDPTPSYARTKGKIPVFVKYDDTNSSDKGIYIYQVQNDNRLRGFYD